MKFYYCFPGGSDGKVSACNAGDPGSIPGLGRHPSEGNGNPLQYSYLENPMDGGAWLGYSPCVHKESDTTEWLHFLSFHSITMCFFIECPWIVYWISSYILSRIFFNKPYHRLNFA